MDYKEQQVLNAAQGMCAILAAYYEAGDFPDDWVSDAGPDAIYNLMSAFGITEEGRVAHPRRVHFPGDKEDKEYANVYRIGEEIFSRMLHGRLR